MYYVCILCIYFLMYSKEKTPDVPVSTSSTRPLVRNTSAATLPQTDTTKVCFTFNSI